MILDYESIKNEYEYIRHKNLIAYEEKKNAIYKDNQTLKDLDQKIVSLYVKECLQDEENLKNIDEQINAIKLERENYLKSHGIKDDYLEVNYDCNKCKDTGFIDGKKCSCFTQREIDQFDKLSNLKEIIKKDNFANLNEKLYNQPIKTLDGTRDYKDYMKNAIQHMKDSVRNIDKEPYNALFIGATGTGKTFLSHCIAAECIKMNKSVLYVNVNEYIDSRKPVHIGEDLLEYAIMCDLFILDDLGTENTSDFTNAELNYIIDKRLVDNKSTIVTTNLDAREISKRYLHSMTSRMLSMYVKYLLNGEDLRGILYANI